MSHSITVLGPPGSGKSHFAMKALKAEGSGVVLLAPGLAEEASYRAFRDNPKYIVKGFDDPEFIPAIGSVKAEGFVNALHCLSGILKSLKAGGPKPAILVTDTFSAFAELAVNATMAKFKRTEAPPAMSPDGASYWTHVAQLMGSMARLCRAIRGEGVHWISLCHISEREMKEVAGANPENLSTTGAKGHTPAISGGFRDVYAREFDLVLHAGVKKEVVKEEGKDVKKTVFYLQSAPSAKRPTKSRYNLPPMIRNDWVGLVEKLNTQEGAGV
jgi:hypothetical protein